MRPKNKRGIPDIDLRVGQSPEAIQLLPDNSVSLIVTSPPYNCRKQYGNFDDQVAWPDYYAWMGQVLDECYRVLEPGGVLAIVIPSVVRWQALHRFAHTWSDYDPTYKAHRNGQKVVGKGRIEPVGFRLFEMMRERDRHVREPIVWVKGSDGKCPTIIASDYRMGCDSDPHLRVSHEFILLGSKQRWFHRGGTGRRGEQYVPLVDYTKDTWFIPPVSSRVHPAPFPVEIPCRLIRLFTHAHDVVVFDPFMGIGTTGLAAISLGRSFIGIDAVPRYVEIARSRLTQALHK